MRRCRVALILAGLAVGVGSEWASYETGELDTAMADLAAGWALLGCGLVAWNRRPESRVGALMAAAGIAWFLGGFLPAALYLHRGPLVHLLLSYPSGRLTRRRDRVVVAASYVDGAIEPLARSPVATLILCGAIVIATCDSYLRASGPRRRARLVPSVGAAGVVLVLGFGALARLSGLDAAEPTLLAYEAVLAAIAGGLLADLLRGRWSQSAVTGLVVDLGGLSEPISLRDRIARALGDPSLQLGYWLGDRYVDERGRPFSLPGSAAGRAVTPVASEGERVAVLVHDAAVLDDPALVEAIAAATRIAVSNVRLRAEVQSRVDQLAASRRRVVEAADAQRRRLQSELHEGAERRLAAVSAHVDALSMEVEEPQARDLLRDVEEQLATARAELSELARGIHPPALTAGGLAAALPELARRAPVPVEVSVDAARCPAAVEAAAYFVCAEALANMAKHAKASRVSVSVKRGEARLWLIKMPPTHTDEGILAAHEIRASHPDVGVLVLSHYLESVYAMRLLEEHPERVGYLLKERVADIAVLGDAMRRIAEGESVLDPTIVARLVQRKRDPGPLASLTDREREVLGLIAEGRSNQAVGEHLFLSPKTVETHIRQIFQKLGLGGSPDSHRRVLAVLAFLRAR